MTWWPMWLMAAALLGPSAPAGRLADVSAPALIPRTRLRRLVRLLPVVAGLATLVFLIAGRVTVMVAVLIAGLTVAHLVDSARTARQAQRIEATTGTLLGHVIADLRSGSLIAPAFSRATADLPEEAPTVLKETFSSVAAHTSRGGAGHVVLATAPELAGLAKIWALAESHGLPAAVLLEQARDRLAARARQRSATSASLQGAQATAAILAALPLAGITLGSGMGADPLGFLLSGGLGGILLIVGVCLVCAGAVISRLIITRAST